MRIICLALAITAINTPKSKADDLSLDFEFSRMKVRSDYPNDLTKPMKEGQFFVLWVGYEDPQLFGQILKEKPDAVHSYIESEKLENKPKSGLVLGIRRRTAVEQVKEISASNSGALKAEEVILTLKSLDRKAAGVEGLAPVQTPPQRPLQYQHGGSALERISGSSRGSGIVSPGWSSQNLYPTQNYQYCPPSG
jgi:hypothetical protein